MGHSRILLHLLTPTYGPSELAKGKFVILCSPGNGLYPHALSGTEGHDNKATHIFLKPVVLPISINSYFRPSTLSSNLLCYCFVCIYER